MGWDDGTPSVTVLTDEEESWLELTSTATSWDDGRWRMFGPSATAALWPGLIDENETDFSDSSTVASWAANWLTVQDWHTFVYSDEADGSFEISNTSGRLDHRVYRCRVPMRRTVSALERFGSFDIVYDGTGAASEVTYAWREFGLTSAHLSRSPFRDDALALDPAVPFLESGAHPGRKEWSSRLRSDLGLDHEVEDVNAGTILYKDPSLTDLGEDDLGEGRGWLLLTTRARFAGTSGGSSPDDSVGDLVAWWAPPEDPGFLSDQVLGPFRLVGCTDCATDLSGNVIADVRFWVGTSGAVVLTPPDEDVEYLYVYYVVERSEYLVSGRTYEEMDLRLTQLSFTPGIYLRRIRLEALLAAIDAPLDWTDESAWGDFPNATGLIDGEVRGKVLFWTVEGWSAGDLDVTQEMLDPYVAATLQLADPAPVWNGEDLALFVAVLLERLDKETDAGEIPTDGLPATFAGVWCGAALDESISPDDFGRYFTVRWDATTQSSPDRVKGNTVGISPALYANYLDPDPVTDGTTWYVHVGSQRLQSLSLGDLERYQGTPDLVFREPLDATIPA